MNSPDKADTPKRESKEVMNSIRAREIVSEILNFGVNQHQMKKIIKFLSLELEDRNLMQKIAGLIDNDLNNEDQAKPKIEI